MWCSPTASPQTHPRVFFFPTSASGFRSSKRTSTLFFDFIAIVAAVMQPAMPAPTTTTSLSSNYNPLEGLSAALLKPTLGFRSRTRRLLVKSLYYLRTGRSRENQENRVDNQSNSRGPKPTLPGSMAQDHAHPLPASDLCPSSSRRSNRISGRPCLQPGNLPAHPSGRQSHPDRYKHA